MSQALTWKGMSPELLKVAERARREPDGQFHSLAHLLDEAALNRAYHRQRPDAAVGVDGITKEDYGQDLEDNLRNLHERMKTKRYRHQPIWRVHIPKDHGKTRPLGISAFEDKVVQDALREVLQAVYEQDFLDCSYGYRPGRSAHDALRALHGAADRSELNCVLEADIVSFFDSLDRQALLGMLQERVADGSLLRLVSKCPHVGVLDGAESATPDTGTAQGSILSPLLGNIYLPYVLDQWFHQEVQPRLRGRACLIRYADDLVSGFQYREDAERVLAVLPKRMQRYGLTLHPDKTRLLDFRRPPQAQQRGKGPDTFDFLVFTLYWRRTRGGRWRLACKTRRARLRRAIQAVSSWCCGQRHEDLQVQHGALRSRLQGHYNYFGVNGNLKSLARLLWHARRAWYKWLRRRSQRTRLNWARFQDLLRSYPLPEPRVMVPIWGVRP
ncbi:MAG: group II intron reverse transcriptase/maturase [Planctomycetia bacterium]|nr:group II intron reverse transcriptase/maturase [Planctomycetia bacterium]